MRAFVFFLKQKYRKKQAEITTSKKVEKTAVNMKTDMKTFKKRKKNVFLRWEVFHNAHTEVCGKLADLAVVKSGKS